MKAEASSGEHGLTELGANLTLQLTVRQSAGMNRATYRLANLKTGRRSLKKP